MTTLDFGSLNPILAATPEGRSVLGSPGPVADRFLLAADPVMAIVGPQGSAKTTTCVKKALLEAQRMVPGPNGVRRYVLGAWRRRYDDLWKATIPSWWKILPRDLPGANWNGAAPRAAQHTIRFKDDWTVKGYGEIEIVARFEAFGDVASPEDLRGKEYTDNWLNEMDTLEEELLIYLIGRIGRDPPFKIAKRLGRIFGDMNAPDIDTWCYRHFYETPKAGYVLYRQPGGREAGAENIDVLGREYYEQQAMLNADRPWWIRRMIDNVPGFTRETDLVYPAFDDLRMRSPIPLKPERHRPVMVGIDGALTPAAAYGQELGGGQWRTLAEVALDRGGPAEIARAMLALEAARFPDCEFVTVCDPALATGEDLEDLSYRQALEKHLGRPVKLARTNVAATRWEAVRCKLALTLDGGAPGFLLDPSCRVLLRGFLRNYHFRKLRGTTDLSSVQPTFETHVHDALQYAMLESGSAAASQSIAARRREREQRREAARQMKRFNPLARRRA